jgi:hypothetical protein
MMIGWNTTFQKMLHIACFVIFSDQILEIKLVDTRLLLKGLKIEKK